MPEEEAVKKIQKFLSRAPDGKDTGVLTLEAMARQTTLSKWHFHRLFKKLVGLAPVNMPEVNLPYSTRLMLLRVLRPWTPQWTFPHSLEILLWDFGLSQSEMVSSFWVRKRAAVFNNTTKRV
jgi:AraC-like DNA-binding protein